MITIEKNRKYFSGVPRYKLLRVLLKTLQRIVSMWFATVKVNLVGKLPADAATDGEKGIFILDPDYSETMDMLSSEELAVFMMGLTVHEMFHLFWTDLQYEKKILDLLEKGKLKELSNLTRFCKNSKQAKRTLHFFLNIFEDAHINRRGKKNFPRFAAPLNFVYKIYNRDMVKLDEMDFGNNKQNKLLIFMEFCNQFAIRSRNPEVDALEEDLKATLLKSRKGIMDVVYENDAHERVWSGLRLVESVIPDLVDLDDADTDAEQANNYQFENQDSASDSKEKPSSIPNKGLTKQEKQEEAQPSQKPEESSDEEQAEPSEEDPQEEQDTSTEAGASEESADPLEEESDEVQSEASEASTGEGQPTEPEEFSDDDVQDTESEESMEDVQNTPTEEGDNDPSPASEESSDDEDSSLPEEGEEENPSPETEESSDNDEQTSEESEDSDGTEESSGDRAEGSAEEDTSEPEESEPSEAESQSEAETPDMGENFDMSEYMDEETSEDSGDEGGTGEAEEQENSSFLDALEADIENDKLDDGAGEEEDTAMDALEKSIKADSRFERASSVGSAKFRVKEAGYESLSPTVKTEVDKYATKVVRLVEKEVKTRTEGDYMTYQLSGRLNGGRVTNFCTKHGLDRYRLFDRKTEGEEGLDISVELLIDESGSMGFKGGFNGKNAVLVAAIIHETCKRLNIPVRICSFDDDTYIYCDFEEPCKATFEKRLCNYSPRGGTDEAQCLTRLERSFFDRPEKHKYLFLVSDGAPGFYVSEGTAESWLRDYQKYAIAKGVHFVACCTGDSAERVAAIYDGPKLIYNEYEQLARRLTNELIRPLRT